MGSFDKSHPPSSTWRNTWTLLSLCVRNAEEKLFSIVWRRRTVKPPRFVYEKGGVCRGAVHEKGRVEMRGGGEAAALRPWQDGVREEKHAVILVLE